ncbi:MAG: hypothetical protein ACEY3K_18190 [Wolbachia sp.]
MDLDDLTKVAFSIIKDDDPYKESKQLQIRNWGRGYLELINTRNLPFFLDILSDKKCWEKADTIHGIRLNRRVAAKKMIEPQSWRGTNNPLDDFDRYQVACWCCLEEDIIFLFEHFKQKHKVKDGDSDALKKLAKTLSGSYYTDAMMQFWSHFVSGYISELDLEGQHPYVVGLSRSVAAMSRKRVEAVEFFWDKIKLLPENELNVQQKDEVFMKIAVRAAKDSSYPEVFEFCFSQVSPDKYSELLRRDFAQDGYYDTLFRLKGCCSFDKLIALFNHLHPNDISERDYYTLLRSVEIKDYSEYYAKAGVEFFMHMWKREGFDNHRVFTLQKELVNLSSRGFILKPLVDKSYMESVWAVLDKASSNQIKEFMASKEANYMRSVLEQKDAGSLNKFLAYGKSATEDLHQEEAPNLSGNLAEAKVSSVHGQPHVG